MNPFQRYFNALFLFAIGACSVWSATNDATAQTTDGLPQVAKAMQSGEIDRLFRDPSSEQ